MTDREPIDLDAEIRKLEVDAEKWRKLVALQREVAMLRNESASTNGEVSRIQWFVAARYGVSLSEMLSKRRTERLVWARWVAMYAVRTRVGLTLEKVGEAFGCRDHGTVLHGVRSVEERMSAYPKVKDEMEHLMSDVDRILSKPQPHEVTTHNTEPKE